VLLNESKEIFEDGLWTNLGVPAGCGVSGDFNGDGKPDVAVNTSEGISILLGTGKALAPLQLGQNIAISGVGCLHTTGDVNGDGILDLVVPTTSGVVTYLGNGDGTFTLKSTTAAPNPSTFLVLGDFNHDGKLDFATAGNALAYGNGDGTFQTPQSIVADPPAQGFANIAVGDINSDGWPDLVMPVLTAPLVNVYVLLNNHKGVFKQAPTDFGAGPSQPVLADVNSDGNLDLLLDNLLYIGNGKGGFTYQTQLSAGVAGEYSPATVADLNGDGIPDITILTPGSLYVYLGLGNATYATPFYLGTRPSPSSLFAADLHGQKTAGFPDFVVPDETGGVLVLINTTK
jgi:hypothetical protein